MNVVGSFYSSRFQKSCEELLVSPMPTYLILVGFVLGGVVRGIIVGFLVLLTSLIFTDITVQNMRLQMQEASFLHEKKIQDLHSQLVTADAQKTIAVNKIKHDLEKEIQRKINR